MRQELKPQEITEPKQLFGKAMSICIVGFGPQDGVIGEQAIQDIEGLACRTGDQLRPIDAPLIRDMGVDGHGAIVIAEVARTETPHQGIRVQGKALAIGRGRQAVPPDTTEFETVMIIHQDRIGGFEGVLAQEPRREIL